MPRTRVSERTRWEQLANAVIELGQNVKVLEERVKTLEGGVSDLGWRKAEPVHVIHESV